MRFLPPLVLGLLFWGVLYAAGGMPLVWGGLAGGVVWLALFLGAEWRQELSRRRRDQDRPD